MTEEDEEFNRIEREAKQRMEAVSAALNKMAENAKELGLDYEPAQEPAPLRDVIVANLVREGVNKHKARELADHFINRTNAQQQEPVAYLCENAVGHKYFRWKKPSSTYKPIALYTSPPAQRTWVGLTDEERTEIRREHFARTLPLMDAVEAKLKEKNATAQPVVPDAIGPNEDELPSYAAGWNDCRALMLEMRKP